MIGQSIVGCEWSGQHLINLYDLINLSIKSASATVLQSADWFDWSDKWQARFCRLINSN